MAKVVFTLKRRDFLKAAGVTAAGAAALAATGVVPRIASATTDPNTITSVLRVRLLVTAPFPPSSGTLSVAAVGVDKVGGAGTDIVDNVPHSYCDIHFDDVHVGLTSATLIGKVVAASNSQNYGAFVKVTASTGTPGMANFVFESLPDTTGAKTGSAGINLTGTVEIDTVL